MINAVESPRVLLDGATLWPLSVTAYHVLSETGLIPKNTELLYGFVYKKMSKSPLHSALVARLLRLIAAVAPGTHVVRSEQPITCADSEPEPDISVVRGTESDFWNEHPQTADLVIEVCVTSHDFDRSKLHAYASAGVAECWLVLGPEKQVEVYRQPKDGEFKERKVGGPGGKLSSSVLPEFTLSLDSFFER